MLDLYRQQLAIWRKVGLDIFVLPDQHSPDGEAWAVPAVKSPNGKISLHINITGNTDHPIWLFVLLHEVGHHALKHTTRWNTVPAWSKEYSADQSALEVIREVQPEAADVCEQASKDHIRPLLQDMIDCGIWHHVNEEVAAWAGCDLSSLPPCDLSADPEIPF